MNFLSSVSIWHHHWCWGWCHLWTILPARGLILETSCFAHTCMYAPSLCTSNIWSVWPEVFKWQPFWLFLCVPLLSTWLCLQPSYLVQLNIYIGSTHAQGIMQLWLIFLPLWLFKKIHILHFYMHYALRCILHWMFCVGCIHVSDLLSNITNELRSPWTYFHLSFHRRTLKFLEVKCNPTH